MKVLKYLIMFFVFAALFGIYGCYTQFDQREYPHHSRGYDRYNRQDDSDKYAYSDEDTSYYADSSYSDDGYGYADNGYGDNGYYYDNYYHPYYRRYLWGGYYPGVSIGFGYGFGTFGYDPFYYDPFFWDTYYSPYYYYPYLSIYSPYHYWGFYPRYYDSYYSPFKYRHGAVTRLRDNGGGRGERGRVSREYFGERGSRPSVSGADRSRTTINNRGAVIRSRDNRNIIRNTERSRAREIQRRELSKPRPQSRPHYDRPSREGTYRPRTEGRAEPRRSYNPPSRGSNSSPRSESPRSSSGGSRSSGGSNRSSDGGGRRR